MSIRERERKILKNWNTIYNEQTEKKVLKNASTLYTKNLKAILT